MSRHGADLVALATSRYLGTCHLPQVGKLLNTVASMDISKIEKSEMW